MFDKVALNLPKKSVSLSLLKKKKKERTFVDFWEYPTNTYFLNLLWDTTIIQEFKKKIIGCICIINFWTSLFHQYISLSQSIKEKKNEFYISSACEIGTCKLKFGRNENPTLHCPFLTLIIVKELVQPIKQTPKS